MMMKQVRIKRAGSVRPGGGRCANLLCLVALFAALAGCVSGQQAKQAPGEEKLIAMDQPLGGYVDNGQAEYVIKEQCDLSASWVSDFERAVTMMQNEKYTQAISLLENAIQQSPQVSAPYINLGMAYRRVEQFEKAEEVLKKALSLVPAHPVASHEYGLLLRRMGLFKEARKVYESGLALFPEYLPMRLNLGILCELYLGDLSCAAEQYAVYSAATPDAEEVRIWMADLALRSGR